MHIYIDLLALDTSILRRRAENKSPLSLPIAMEHNGDFYPSEDWWDFGVVIVCWWTWGFIELLSSARVRYFIFMHGPYRIQVRYRRSTRLMELRPIGLECTWYTSPLELAEALKAALETILSILTHLEIDEEPEGRGLLNRRLSELELAVRQHLL